MTLEDLIENYKITLDFDIDPITGVMTPNGDIIVWEHAKMLRDHTTKLLLSENEGLKKEIYEILIKNFWDSINHAS